MPVRIRLSRVGAKKRPIYRIVVADSRRSRDWKFIDRIGTYNPMLSKENPERIKIDSEKASNLKGFLAISFEIVFESLNRKMY